MGHSLTDGEQQGSGPRAGRGAHAAGPRSSLHGDASAAFLLSPRHLRNEKHSPPCRQGAYVPHLLPNPGLPRTAQRAGARAATLLSSSARGALSSRAGPHEAGGKPFLWTGSPSQPPAPHYGRPAAPAPLPPPSSAVLWPSSPIRAGSQVWFQNKGHQPQGPLPLCRQSMGATWERPESPP